MLVGKERRRDEDITPYRSPRTQRGVALVLTLIMLAIITVVTVVFLATARRNRSVTVLRINQTDAEYAAEAAFQRAKGEVLAQILHRTNLLAFDFTVSHGDTNMFTGRHDLVPVVTNLEGTVDFYLDLNRNGRFDEPTNFGGFGDPMWIGILDKPEQTGLATNRNNRFVARMAFLVQPAGKTLDLNTAHHTNTMLAGTGFLRNQGVGPWEINLAALLDELSPAIWQYEYGPFPRPAANREAFVDAASLVSYRHQWGLELSRSPNPKSLNRRFSNAPLLAGFFPSSIDFYSDGNGGVVLGRDPFVPDDDDPVGGPPGLLKKVNLQWPGADPTNHWFHPQEFFELFPGSQSKVSVDFVRNLTNAIALDPTVYYRLVAQLGTDTGDNDFTNKINLNYANLGTSAVFGRNYATNLVPWDFDEHTAVTFFTNVAERLFQAQFNDFNPAVVGGVRVTNIPSVIQIPVAPTNFYSAGLHRLLQVAANIFDATRTNQFPSVFRPLLTASNGITYIYGYTNENFWSAQFQSWMERDNTNAVPVVVGAKKGFPNFNEFTLRSDVLVSRKLQVVRDRPDPAASLIGTNQMYLLGISNYFGLEAWNSYRAPYPRDVTIWVSNHVQVTLSNQTTRIFTLNTNRGVLTNLLANAWSGRDDTRTVANNFILPMQDVVLTLSNSVYRFASNGFSGIGINLFEPTPGYPVPYWVMTVSNRLNYVMFDRATQRILDCVSLISTQVVDIHRELLSGVDPYSGSAPVFARLWQTNRTVPNGPTYGILQQIQVSSGTPSLPLSEWTQYGTSTSQNDSDKALAIDAFRAFIGLTPYTTNNVQTNALAMQAPFNPAARISKLTTWQANDPLVHYHPADLQVKPNNEVSQYFNPSVQVSNPAPSSLGYMNAGYSPWGGRPNSSAGAPDTFDRMVKDPGVYSSDDWQFPSNKLASVGLLGRIHRGTPWQTIYLKPEIAAASAWNTWASDSRAHPVHDWPLVDMFTTALDERSATGLLSINQTNLAAWSAVLSGVVVLSNALPNAAVQMGGPGRPTGNTNFVEHIIEPTRGDTNSALYQLYAAIQQYRELQTNSGRQFRSLGEILQVPELTVASPFLTSPANDQKPEWRFDDASYEWLPQQILSLLRVGEPRVVIYAFGQSLKPASFGPDGVADNYQVTAEHATRTVLRIEGDPRDRNAPLRAVIESFNILPPEL